MTDRDPWAALTQIQSSVAEAYIQTERRPEHVVVYYGLALGMIAATTAQVLGDDPVEWLNDVRRRAGYAEPDRSETREEP